jgi:hypothetical protein
MRKLTLDPDKLRVESFAADEGDAAPRGTVEARSFVTIHSPNAPCGSEATPNCQPTDYHVYSCGVSCIEMCFLTGGMPTCDA